MRVWPRSLSGRIVMLTLLALVVSQMVSFFIFMHERDRFVERVIVGNMSESVASAIRTLDFVPTVHRGQALAAMSTEDLRYRLARTPGRLFEHNADENSDQARGFEQEFARRVGVEVERVHVAIGPGLAHGPSRRAGDALRVAVQLDDGAWLRSRQRLFDPTRRWARFSLITLVVSGLFMAVIVIVTSRRMTRPLRDLARAAERFGRGEEVAPLPEQGAEEIRRSVTAFNRMRERLARFVAERTRMVAALAHDLRTPITALRLRLEFLPDDDNTRAMAATLDDMANMSEASLTFMREEAANEATRNVDLSALIDALCEDYRASGATVTFEPEARIALVCRPVAIRRALRNIIDNALAYGREARIALVDGDQAVTIEIIDAGPGIDEADMSRVFDPFVRLESSRSRDTGGTGLGLSIARSVVQGHGGEIALVNREAGGLCVQIRLPRDRLA
ncbi:Signal transduction histidine kinase [Salinisphaera dokdonensis CL-ES53]|uniref:histidine kinase n=1 Tax=Salinisphaera dokdonensis CL-ES53 TaxID=1304272 RepID=A0ABV2B1X9_9GAMM